MTDIAQYIMDNYYGKYTGNDRGIIPTEEQLEQVISNHSDKIVIVRDDKIRGVAIYLKLSDRSYQTLKAHSITSIDAIKALIPENGRNLHFVLLAADSYQAIMVGLRATVNKIKPRSISWFSPDFKRLHKRSI